MPLSTCDFPGRLAAVVFLQGCPWACGYCHNPHLRPPGRGAGPPWPAVRDWLATRRSLLDAVVFSGGEPLRQRGLIQALAEVRALGFETALHTTGMSPRRFVAALPHLDWVGFDVKAPFADYPRVTGVPGGAAAARRSLRVLLASGVACELRTTLHPRLLGPDALLALADELASLGVRDWVLQFAQGTGCLDPRCDAPPWPDWLDAGFVARLTARMPGLRWRHLPEARAALIGAVAAA
ncbi:MAG: anaerobic ribonucleoside-triphosphate reductase activating protein [Gammaproteobacteria bacterium]|nr:MAG: anaerobic ribonucleoside-triphosphate reductase activating protein [Gammaproteobacteria bacterium]